MICLTCQSTPYDIVNNIWNCPISKFTFFRNMTCLFMRWKNRVYFNTTLRAGRTVFKSIFYLLYGHGKLAIKQSIHEPFSTVYYFKRRNQNQTHLFSERYFCWCYEILNFFFFSIKKKFEKLNLMLKAKNETERMRWRERKPKRRYCQTWIIKREIFSPWHGIQ